MQQQDISRRVLLKSSAAATGLILGFHLPGNPLRFTEAFGADATKNSAPAVHVNTWLRIASDGVITIYIARSEMGQGIFTAMPMLVAEELEADWQKIRVEPAPSDAAFNYSGRPIEVTGGSSSVNANWDTLQRIGATARHLLIAAAAQKWQVAPESCSAKSGYILHADSDRKISFGEIASDAAKIPVDSVPRDLKLKAKSDYQFVGKPMKRLDTPAKVAGRPLFGIDVRVPGMQYAAVRHAPVFGGECTNFAALQTSLPKGTSLVKVNGGIVVVADSWWTAKNLVEGLKPQWSKGEAAGISSSQITSQLRTAASGKQLPVATKVGDTVKAFASAKTKVSAEYTTPYLAHTPMEPLNCTAHVRADGIELWVGTQSHTLTKLVVSNATKVPQAKIKVHTTYLGGGFGRRIESDMVLQAVATSKAVGKPVQLIWSREEDVQHDFYRPASLVKFEAGLDAKGQPQAFHATIASSSILKRWTLFGGVGKDGLDFSTVEGLRDIRYACPNILVEQALVEIGVPVGFWRSVGSSHNAFFVESFIDEIAHAAGRDPYKYRRDLLHPNHPRYVKVLDTVAEMSGWKQSPPKGRFRGVAIAESFGSIVAEVCEISIEQAQPVVHNVWVAVDCGRYVNPETVAAQMESGVVYGLAAALRGEITLKDGQVQQSNFHDYPMLAPHEMPTITVRLIENDEAPGGVGEPGTPPIAAALTNAIFAATGKRIRSLPVSKHKLA